MSVVRGPVRRAIEASIRPGDVLRTPSRGAPFVVATIDADGVVLLLGEKRAHTRFAWHVLEGVDDLLADETWIEIGSSYSTDARPGTLDAYLKRHVNRATAGWVASLLEAAGTLEIERGRPARVRRLGRVR